VLVVYIPTGYKDGLMWCINFEITDEKNKLASVQVCLADSLLWAVVEAAAGQIAALLDNIITGYVTGISVSREVALPGGISTAPVAGSDREEGGLIVYNSAGGVAKQRIPTLNETFILAGTDLIDQALGAMETWLDFMKDGITVSSTLVAPVDSRGEDIVTVRSAREDFRRYKRG